MGKQKGLVLIGDGGHAHACLDLIESITSYSVSLGGKLFVEHVIPDTRKLMEEDWIKLAAEYKKFVLGIGQIHSPELRKKIVTKIKDRGGEFVTLISPYAKVSPNCKIGEGVVIMPNVSVNRYAIIDEFCILNTGCIIEHDATIGKFSHISTGAVVNGDCVIGSDCFVGSNAVLLNQIRIYCNSSIGAGSVVTKDIKSSGIYVGNPAAFLRDKGIV